MPPSVELGALLSSLRRSGMFIAESLIDAPHSGGVTCNARGSFVYGY